LIFYEFSKCACFGSPLPRVNAKDADEVVTPKKARGNGDVVTPEAEI
jgi:hypothetical protein